MVWSVEDPWPLPSKICLVIGLGLLSIAPLKTVLFFEAKSLCERDGHFGKRDGH